MQATWIQRVRWRLSAMSFTAWLRRLWAGLKAPYKGPNLPQELGSDFGIMATGCILVLVTGTFPLLWILAIIAARFVGQVIGAIIVVHRRGIAVSTLPRS